MNIVGFVSFPVRQWWSCLHCLASSIHRWFEGQEQQGRHPLGSWLCCHFRRVLENDNALGFPKHAWIWPRLNLAPIAGGEGGAW